MKLFRRKPIQFTAQQAELLDRTLSTYASVQAPSQMQARILDKLKQSEAQSLHAGSFWFSLRLPWPRMAAVAGCVVMATAAVSYVALHRQPTAPSLASTVQVSSPRGFGSAAATHIAPPHPVEAQVAGVTRHSNHRTRARNHIHRQAPRNGNDGGRLVAAPPQKTQDAAPTAP